MSEGFYQKYRAELEAEGFTERTGIELVSDHVFAVMSDTKTPQGVLGIVRRAEYTAETLMGQAAPFLMVLDNLQDPGKSRHDLPDGGSGGRDRDRDEQRLCGYLQSEDDPLDDGCDLPDAVPDRRKSAGDDQAVKEKKIGVYAAHFGRKEHLRSGRLCRRLRVSDRKRGATDCGRKWRTVRTPGSGSRWRGRWNR